MNHLEELQVYLSNLAVFNIKLHNIHWNVVGRKFMEIHEFTEEVYDQMFEDFDEVAELLKTKDITPISTMAGYLEKATIKEIEPEKFSRENALEIVKEDLESMRELATDIRNAADEEGDFETVAMFE
ncbi:MAG TPA: DNA starvation/stationary phase protection protein, partial [Tissierellaceae bacterium]|nr:DNA starvation/stationary phase protection protein [Tissierellaceae bacterium]